MRFAGYCAILFVTLMSSGKAEEAIWEIGVGASNVQVSNTESNSRSTIPTLSFGVYRSINEELRIGSSLEILPSKAASSSENQDILMWRVAEIDYLFNDVFALNLHGGIARYYREQPSYGYGVGIGAKYKLTSNSYLTAVFTKAEVDISTDVPTNNGAPTKDDLEWLSVRLQLVF